MVYVGLLFIFFLIFVLYNTINNKFPTKKRWLRLGIIAFPVAFIASMSGWIVTEVGRQPWAIQDLLPTAVATSNINATSVMITFFMFAILFTTLLIAEIKIMLKTIKSEQEPKGGQNV
jgi:cytochrome d ubiquinol oxidase subunit I